MANSKGCDETYRGVDVEVNLLNRVRVEIAVSEDYVQTMVNALITGP